MEAPLPIRDGECWVHASSFTVHPGKRKTSHGRGPRDVLDGQGVVSSEGDIMPHHCQDNSQGSAREPALYQAEEPSPRTHPASLFKPQRKPCG